MASRLSQILEECPGASISGEEISRRLGTTRAAVWKQVQSLRAKGYEIVGTRGEGYRLLRRPDLINAEALEARFGRKPIWTAFEYFPVTDSTNARAMELAEKGAPHATIVCADAQTSGRGRLGRKWESPPGINLYLTVILRPPIEPYRAPQLTLMTAIALAQAVEETTGLACALKWPNDLYIGGRKAAGILAEMAADPDRLRHVAVGIGLNVNGLEKDFPEEIRGKATSLRIQAGRSFARVDILAEFLTRLSEAYHTFLAGGFAALRPEWTRRALIDGKRVLLRQRGDAEWGTALGVDEEGVLMFRKDGDASIGKIYSGEIIEFEG
ncbi:MAG TPA: biotin--[acetyl-CoA-carboxylase] ligase [Candidatus Deferrimicrobiaceae bacterium]|jgi:BirA family biotin operon repressor/biotin-[acetyl-CoA-carboxylase] ligase